MIPDPHPRFLAPHEYDAETDTHSAVYTPTAPGDMPVVDDGPPHPGPYRCAQTTSGVCAVRPEGSLTQTPCKDTCGWTPDAQPEDVAAALLETEAPERSLAAAFAAATAEQHDRPDDRPEEPTEGDIDAVQALREAMEVTAPPLPPGPAPVPLFAGSYALYDDGTGGFMLVLGQSTGETVRKHFPAHLVKMAEKFGGGPLGALFGGV